VISTLNGYPNEVVSEEAPERLHVTPSKGVADFAFQTRDRLFF
jgi:hypothetical protein